MGTKFGRHPYQAKAFLPGKNVCTIASLHLTVIRSLAWWV